MKKTGGVGSIIKKVSVIRADGTNETVAENIHNIINNSAAFNIDRTETAGSWIYVYLTNTRIRELKDGEWSQTGDEITRVSGSLTFALGDIIQWPDGDWSYVHTQLSTNPYRYRVSNEKEQSAVVPYHIRSSKSQAEDSFRDQSFSGFRNSTYSDGVVTTINNNPMILSPASSTETLSRINITGVLHSSWQYGCYLDLPSDVTLNIGDSLVIEGFELKITFDEYEPRVLAECPLDGITTSCRAQRLIPITSGLTNENRTPNRIWLIEDGDEYILPNLQTSGNTNPNVLDVTETIVAIGSSDSPGSINNATASNSCYGLVATGSASVKQIAWGDTSYVFGILEFDTPQNIPAGKIITIGGNQKFKIDVPLP